MASPLLSDGFEKAGNFGKSDYANGKTVEITSTVTRPVMEIIVVNTVHVFSVSVCVSPPISLTSQNPESLYHEQMFPPAPMAITMYTGLTDELCGQRCHDSRGGEHGGRRRPLRDADDGGDEPRGHEQADTESLEVACDVRPDSGRGESAPNAPPIAVMAAMFPPLFSASVSSSSQSDRERSDQRR